VGHAQDDVRDVGVRLDDARHRAEHDFDALVPVHQAEGQDGSATLQAELVLVVVAVDERQVGDPVGDQSDLVVSDAVDVGEHVDAAFVHGDHDVGTVAQLQHGSAVGRLRRLQDGVQRGDHRRLHTFQQQAQVRAGLASEEPEFVLHRNQVDVAEIDVVGRTDVVPSDILADLELHRIVVSQDRIRSHGHNERFELPAGSGCRVPDQVRGECCDAAFPRRKARYEDDLFPRVFSHPCPSKPVREDSNEGQLYHLIAIFVDM